MSYTSLAKRPTKPPSGYNIFYAGESKRTRGRERAELAYFHKVLQRKIDEDNDQATSAAAASPPTSKNKTKFIGGKWKALRPHSREVFAIRSRDELEVYHVNKMLWGVLDRLLDNAGMSWDDAAAPGGGRRNNKSKKKKTSSSSSGDGNGRKVDNPKPPGFPRELDPGYGGLLDEEAEEEFQEALMLFLG